MYVIRSFRHAAAKGTSTGELVRTVAAALREAQHGKLVFQAYFSEMKHRKVSPLVRLIERYPDLLIGDGSAAAKGKALAGVEALASMPEAPEEQRAGKGTLRIRALDVETAIEIADGIPQRYPLWESHFLVSPVPSLAVVPAVERRSFTIGVVHHPEILVYSGWRSPRREVGIWSAASCAAPVGGQKRLAPLPASVKALLVALGKPGREAQQLVPDDEERAAKQMRAMALAPEVERLDAALEASWASAPFPRKLRDDHRHEERDMDLRAELVGALAPTGWAQTSEGFRRRTARGHELSIVYDRKPLANTVEAWLTVRGFDWSHTAKLWPHAESHMLRIRSPQTASLYAVNLAAAAAHAVTRWAEPIEALYGDGAGWLPR